MHMSCVKLTECKYVLLILIFNSANDNNNFYLICFFLDLIYKWVYIQLERGTNQSTLPLRNQQNGPRLEKSHGAEDNPPAPNLPQGMASKSEERLCPHFHNRVI